MKSLKILLIYGGVITLLITACKKDSGTDPKPEENLITGLPALGSVPGSSVSFEAATSTYTVTVPSGTDVKALRLSIPLVEGATISPDPTIARNYTNPLKYTITANGKTYQITVKVEVSLSSKSSAKQITSFRFVALGMNAEIDQTTRKITAKVSSNDDITKLVPTITFSEKATVSPASNTAQNFTNPINYTITAEDGSKQVYEVKVEKEAIGGGKACLLTRSEQTYGNSNGQQYTYITEYGYDEKSRIVSVKSFESGNIENSKIMKISYNTNGDVAEVQDNISGSDLKTRFTYQNNKVIKMEVESFYKGTSIWVDYIAFGVVKLNNNNELIEYNEFNNSQDGFSRRYILKLEYQNQNISKVEFYDDDNKKWNRAELGYDNKHSPLFASNPNPVFKAIFLYGLRREWFGRNNVVSQKDIGGGTRSISVSYKYNDNNYPVEARSTDGEIWKYHYSNCN